ncbi:hypothetical protein REA19_39880 [Prescottella equi]|nr:hypothetical protein REA19_39880 [Prescottella equi]
MIRSTDTESEPSSDIRTRSWLTGAPFLEWTEHARAPPGGDPRLPVHGIPAPRVFAHFSRPGAPRKAR